MEAAAPNHNANVPAAAAPRPANNNNDIMDADDPRRMELTEQERQQALEIRDAIRSLPDLDEVSDFMCVQLAIICRDMNEAIERAYGMQAYRQEYKILDTYDDACRRIREMIKLFPKKYLSFSYCAPEGRYVYVYDFSELNLHRLRTEEDFNTYFAGSQYLHTAMSPDFASIRTGMMALIECANADWSSKPDFKILTRLFGELHHCYPFRGTAHLYHTGSVINVMVSLLRKVMPPELANNFRVGLRFEDRLDRLFLQPDVATATARLTREIIVALKRRYDNETAFSLDR